MMIKRIYITVVIFMLGFVSVNAQKDMIILRSGMDDQGQVVMVSNDVTVFKNSSGEQQEIPNRNLYMIKYDKRGNVFFTETGERITDNENEGKTPKGSSLIYLIEGKEIVAFDVSIDVNNVSFFPINKKGSFLPFSSKKSDTQVKIPKERVFLIKHQDGTKDLITDFETIKKRKAEELARKRAQDEKAKREAWLRSFPKSATIITKKEIVINAIVLSDDENVISFKRITMSNSPIFMMDKEHIQDVFYKDM